MRTRNRVDVVLLTRKTCILMEKAVVLHNPGAGEGETSGKDIVAAIESAGFKCSYSSTKEFRWKDLDTAEIDFLILAGGDGTVRKVAEVMLNRPVLERRLPLGLLPYGTANNIAKTLGMNGSTAQIVNSWRNSATKRFDVGTIEGLDKPTFFLESFGCGLFPKLMKEMATQGHNEIDDPKEKIKVALTVLLDLVMNAPTKKCDLQMDGVDYSGEFLLIEVMNIRSIGPNLGLAPNADPGDGAFDVVLINEAQRIRLAEYVRHKCEGMNVPFEFPVLKASKIKMFWNGRHVHVDDEYSRLGAPVEISINVHKGLLEFVVPCEVRDLL